MIVPFGAYWKVKNIGNY